MPCNVIIRTEKFSKVKHAFIFHQNLFKPFLNDAKLLRVYDWFRAWSYDTWLWRDTFSGITPPDVKPLCVNWWLWARGNILKRIVDPRPVVIPKPNPTHVIYFSVYIVHLYDCLIAIACTNQMINYHYFWVFFNLFWFSQGCDVLGWPSVHCTFIWFF